MTTMTKKRALEIAMVIFKNEVASGSIAHAVYDEALEVLEKHYDISSFSDGLYQTEEEWAKANGMTEVKR